MKIDNPQSHVVEHSDNVFIDRISNKIYDSGLITSAIFFLEMTKPISLLGSHFLIFLGPVVNAFIQSDQELYSLGELLSKVSIMFLKRLL